MKLIQLVACNVKEEVPLIGKSSGKWNRGSPRVPARPFVSGVEREAAIREGQWREISGEGERESDWETSRDAQWKFWSLIGHLIYWSYRGDWASDYLRDYLVPVCSSVSLSPAVSLCLPPTVAVPLFHSLSLSPSLFLCCYYLYMSPKGFSVGAAGSSLQILERDLLVLG